VSGRRGTTNGNARGGSGERRRRREWLVVTYRADTDVMPIEVMVADIGPLTVLVPVPLGLGELACRCYRCGALLTVVTVSADRIVPGCQGGSYRRDNIRPACELCNSITGGAVRRSPRSGRKINMPQVSARRNSRHLSGRAGTIVEQGSISSRKAAPCGECGAQPGFSCNSLISVRQVREGREGAYLKPMAKLHRSRGRAS
jgi:hypothetical protein